MTAALGHVPVRLRPARVDHVLGLTTVSLAAAERSLASTGHTRLAVPDLVADLVDVCTAVLEAPSSAAASPSPLTPATTSP